LIDTYDKVPNLENLNNHSAHTNSENVLESGDSNYARYNKHDTPFPNNYHQKTNRALYEKSIVDYLKYSSNSTYETQPQQLQQQQQQQQQTQQPLQSSRTSKNKSGGKQYFSVHFSLFFLILIITSVVFSKIKIVKNLFQIYI